MMFKIETKEDFDELMLGQKKFRNFIKVNKSRNWENKCATNQKILINKLIRSGIMPERSRIIDDFNDVLTRTDIFDFTNEDGSTTIKLSEWHKYIADLAIKDFDALLKNEQVYFSDDNGGPLRFVVWYSRINSGSIKNFNDILARDDITFEKCNNYGYITFNEFKDKLANGAIKNFDFIIDKDGKVKEDNLGFKDFVRDITNLKYFAPETFYRIDLNNSEHRSLLSIKPKEAPGKIVFGWNLLGYLLIMFTLGLACSFGWSQKLFANAIANDWYNGSYIAKLQKRKKDIEMVVEPVLNKTDNSNKQDEQWGSKSDDGIIRSQVKRIPKVVNTENNVSRPKRIENTTKNDIGTTKTKEEVLNSKNKSEQNITDNNQTDHSNNNDKKATEGSNSEPNNDNQSAQIKDTEQKHTQDITKNNTDIQNKASDSNQSTKKVMNEIIQSITEKMPNLIRSQDNDRKTIEESALKQITVDSNAQIDKNIESEHKKSIIEDKTTKKTHVKKNEKESTNKVKERKQSYGVAEFLADFKDATGMNFIFLDDKDAQKKLQDKLVKLGECKAKYNEIFEANKDALQKYESKKGIKIANEIDWCMKDAKLELDNRGKKTWDITPSYGNVKSKQTISREKCLSQNLANSNLNSPFQSMPTAYPSSATNDLYQGQKSYMILATNGTEMDNKPSYLTKKTILNPSKPKPSQNKKFKKINYIVDEEDDDIT